MSNNVHEQVREWLLEDAPLSAEQEREFRQHLATCPDCTKFAERIETVAGAVKTSVVMADAALVAATRHRLQRQLLAFAEQRHERRLVALGFSLVLLWLPVSAGALWVGGGWIGEWLNLPPLAWQALAVLAMFLPIFLAAAAWLAHRDEADRVTER